jgi:beta-lactamase regulating signal transducer with metallopeptidase domain
VSLVVAALVVVAAIVLPHRLRLEQTPPVFAGAIWLSALLLRAVVALAVAVFAEVYLPTTPLDAPFDDLCMGASGRRFSGHFIGDALLALPTIVLAVSLIWVLIELWRAARRVDELVRHSVGRGPAESLIVADRAMLVAAAGLRRPTVLISAGALLALDDEELAASLDHERGHIARRHRYVVVLAELARALARFVPGTRAAVRELVFHLERDADRYALRRSHDPAVLASAICKAAQDAPEPAPSLGLGGGVVIRRLRLLLDPSADARPRARIGLLALAPAMVALVAASAFALPFVAHDTYHAKHEGQVRHCA